MDATQAIANYQSLATLTAQMLEAARCGEWDELIDIERQCSELVAAMKRLDARVALGEDDRQHKARLIGKILADDAEIRQRVHAWMRQMQLSMQSNRQEQRLLQAYGI